MTRPLQVGFIGARAESGWARESQIPAIRALSGLDLGAVVTTSNSGSDKAAAASGARAGYANAAALFPDGSSVAPDFEHAVRLTRLVDDLLASSVEGRRRDAKDWSRRGGIENA